MAEIEVYTIGFDPKDEELVKIWNETEDKIALANIVNNMNIPSIIKSMQLDENKTQLIQVGTKDKAYLFGKCLDDNFKLHLVKDNYYYIEAIPSIGYLPVFADLNKLGMAELDELSNNFKYLFPEDSSEELLVKYK